MVGAVEEVPSCGDLEEGEGEVELPYFPWEEVVVEEPLGPSGRWVDQEGEGGHHSVDVLQWHV